MGRPRSCDVLCLCVAEVLNEDSRAGGSTSRRGVVSSRVRIHKRYRVWPYGLGPVLYFYNVVTGKEKRREEPTSQIGRVHDLIKIILISYCMIHNDNKLIVICFGLKS